jgi:uncharacterized integral membrane protein
MQTFFLAALAFALVAVMFALQNIVPVQVRFLAWTFEGSLALVLFVALIVGAVIGVLVSVPSMIRARWTAGGLRKQIAALEAELDSHTRRFAAGPMSTTSGDRKPSEGSATGQASSSVGPARER